MGGSSFVFIVGHLLVFVLMAITVSYATSCDDIVCENGGTCIPEPSQSNTPWTCICPDTHYGTLCQVQNSCLSRPDLWCINGTCADVKGPGHMCVCDSGFRGPRCSNFDPCVDKPCNNSGVCEYIRDNHFRCICNRSGYYGDHCELYNECVLEPCQNNGTCIHVDDSRINCTCDTNGYYGNHCELYNPCLKVPKLCQNGGNCTYSGVGEEVVCSCLPAYDGEFCELIDLCSRDRPCMNQGICTPFVTDPPEYECHCQRGYLGKNCQIAVIFVPGAYNSSRMMVGDAITIGIRLFSLILILLSKNFVIFRCPEDITVDIRGFIQWPMLLIHRDIDVECQFGGTANRICKVDDRGKPRWKYPDTSNCHPVNITRDLAKEFTSYLIQTTKNAFEMFEEELESSTELLLAVAKYTYDDIDFAQDVMDCVSNLLFVNKTVMRSSSTYHGTNIQLLDLLDIYKEKAKFDEDSTAISINSDNLNIELQATRFQDFKHGIDYKMNNASIHVPREALFSADGEDRDRVGFITLVRDTFFVEEIPLGDNNTDSKLPDDKEDSECSTDILTDRLVTSAEVINNMVTDLKTPVILMFRIPEVERPFTCVYWNHSVQNWQSGGITRHEQNDTFLTCESDHLTYFSIILDPHYSQQPSSKHQHVLSIISYVGCTITIVSLMITIFSYILFHLLRRTISGKILINLCVALLGLNIMFIANTIHAVVDNVTICQGVAMAMHYFILVTFLWMGVEAVYMHQTLIKVFRSGGTTPFMAKSIFVSWGLPLIPIAVVAGIDLNHYTKENGACMLSKDNLLVYYLSYMGPCILILVVNYIVFFFVLRTVCSSGKNTTQSKGISVRRTHVGCAISISLLLGLTWVFSLLKIGDASLVFDYIFTIVNSLLGFFIFMFRCALNPDAVKSWQICCTECTIGTKRQKRDSGSGLGSGGRNNTLQGQKKICNDSGNYSNEYARDNPNFISETTTQKTNTVMLSVVSRSNGRYVKDVNMVNKNMDSVTRNNLNCQDTYAKI